MERDKLATIALKEIAALKNRKEVEKLILSLVHAETAQTPKPFESRPGKAS